ncbi:MAG: hypothetical protein WKF73_04185 [Nocardioidaceae bacterium]
MIATPDVASSTRLLAAQHDWVRAAVARDRPGDVHGVLGGLCYAQCPVDRADDTDGEGDPTSLQAGRRTDLVADDGEPAQRRVDDLLLKLAVTLQDEAKDR